MSDKYHIQIGVTQDYKRDLFEIIPESDWDSIKYRKGRIFGELEEWRWPPGDPIVDAVEKLILIDEDFYLLAIRADGQEESIGSPWEYIDDFDDPNPPEFNKIQKLVLRVLKWRK